MNDTIINNINKYVKYSDTLFILGDILFGNKIYLPEVISRINCLNIHYILGNHDGYIEKNEEYIKLFSSVQDLLHLEINKSKNIILSHYSMRTWMGSHKGYLHLFGHSHSSISDFGKSFDVGIDAIYKRLGEYRPISFDEVIDIMETKSIEYPDHHNNNTNIK
jgi:calcineurin-like phosphoesterase family protein